MKENNELQLNTEEVIKQHIFIIRGKKVMLDIDLAKIYQVPTKRLNEQVKRNSKRFPVDFMFQLTQEEIENLELIRTQNNQDQKWSQFATTSQRYRSVLYLPYAFTEHGVAMLSSVLKSEQAVQMNLFIIRTFIKMRESLEHYKDLAIKVGEIEVKQIQDHAMLKNVHSVVKHLIEKPAGPKKKFGFQKK
jgi:hypothetical protein